MKKFIMVAIIIVIVLFIVDKFVLKDKGVINKENVSGKYHKIENPDKQTVGIQLNNKAPDFTLTDLEGNEVKLSEYKGKAVVLNFWATWCPPCKAEMPEMQKVYKNSNHEFEILAINLTNTEKSKQDVIKFIKEYNLSFPIPMDQKGAVASQYEVLSYPTSYFIDSDGIVRNKVIGGLSEEAFSDEINKLQ